MWLADGRNRRLSIVDLKLIFGQPKKTLLAASTGKVLFTSNRQTRDVIEFMYFGKSFCYQPPPPLFSPDKGLRLLCNRRCVWKQRQRTSKVSSNGRNFKIKKINIFHIFIGRSRRYRSYRDDPCSLCKSSTHTFYHN